jgi:hypothetical protein
MKRLSLVQMLASVVVVASLALGSVSALATIPQILDYQGFLTDKVTGVPLNASAAAPLSITFNIWDGATGTSSTSVPPANLLYTETQSVTVSNGVFSALIGSGVVPAGKPAFSALTFDKPYFLEIVLGADTLTPRQPLASSAYTQMAANVISSPLFNTATGSGALSSTPSGSFNTASGFQALLSNTTGSYNTAFGAQAVYSNNTGYNNTVTGAQSLFTNTTGYFNTVTGTQSMYANTSGFDNTADGMQALFKNQTGNDNTASGMQAMYLNQSGTFNAALGSSALKANASGSFNTAVGASALSLNTGSSNIAIGYGAGSAITTGSNNILIGAIGSATDSGIIRIGGTATLGTAIAGIRNVITASANAIPVMIDSGGQLGTVSSSRRVKDHIEDMGAASSVLMKLRPVTFRYKVHAGLGDKATQYGLVAEEVAEVAPGLVADNGKGEAETVFYQFLAPMLVNEFQKQQRIIEEQAGKISELEVQAQKIVELEKQVSAVRRELAEFADLQRTANLPRSQASGSSEPVAFVR